MKSSAAAPSNSPKEGNQSSSDPAAASKNRLRFLVSDNLLNISRVLPCRIHFLGSETNGSPLVYWICQLLCRSIETNRWSET